MDRQHRSANKVTDYRRYHLSGDLDTVVEGKVKEVIDLFGVMQHTNMSQPEGATKAELEIMIQEQRENSTQLQQEAEELKLRNMLENKKMQQQQWEAAIQQLREARDLQAQQHQANMEKMKEMAQGHCEEIKGAAAVTWLQENLSRLQLEQPSGTPGIQTPRREDPAKKTALDELYRQQEELQQKIQAMSKEEAPTPSDPLGLLAQALSGHSKPKTEQEFLMEQLRAALAPKEVDKDPNKALLKALITAQNKTSGIGGTSTLKPETLSKLTGNGEFSMAEWLATLNSTKKNLLIHLNAYQKFCDRYLLSYFPCDNIQLCRFGQHLTKSLTSPDSIGNYLSGMCTMLALVGNMVPDAKDKQMQMFTTGLKHMLNHVVQQAAPVTPQLLLRMSKVINYKDKIEVIAWTATLLGSICFCAKATWYWRPWTSLSHCINFVGQM